jgi:putative colanic acid biosysnthesis UDP-glucose lipid carrier transferase
MISLNGVKKTNYSKVLVLILICTDALLILASFGLAKNILSKINYLIPPVHTSLYAVFILWWILCAIILNVYYLENISKTGRIILSTFTGLVVHSLLLWPYILFIAPYTYSYVFVALTYGIFAVASVVVKVFLLKIYRQYRNMDINRKNVIIIGYTEQGKRLREFFENNGALGYRFLGYFDDSFEQYGKNEIKGRLGDIESFCIREEIDEIYYALPYQADYMKKLHEFSDDHFIYFSVIQDASGLKEKKFITEVYDEHISVLSYEKDPIRLVLDFKKPLAFYFKAYRERLRGYYEYNGD